MRILVARCEIAYHGRATTRLARGDRVDPVQGRRLALRACRPGLQAAQLHGRADHGEARRATPSASTGRRPTRRWSSWSRRCSRTPAASSTTMRCSSTTAPSASGTVLLERAPEAIEPGLVVVERERLTDTGPIDLFCRDAEGRTVVVEVKRTRAVAAHVEQLTRTASASTSIPPTPVPRDPGRARDRAAGPGDVRGARIRVRRARLRCPEGRGRAGAHAVRVRSSPPAPVPEAHPARLVPGTQLKRRSATASPAAATYRYICKYVVHGMYNSSPHPRRGAPCPPST